MNSIFSYVFVLMIVLQFQIINAQESDPKPPTPPSNDEAPSNPVSSQDFDSMHSLGYRPKQNSSNIDFLLTNSNSNYSVYLQPTSTSKSQKFYDSNGTRSYLSTSIQYAIEDKTRVGLTFGNVVSSNSKTTYSTEYKAAGYIDSSESRKGHKEPTIFIDRTLKGTHDLRVYGNLSYSPKMEKSSDSNVLRGGDATNLSFELVKAFEKTEFSFGVSYTHYGIRFYEKDSSKRETKDGNDLRFTAYLNFRNTKDSSFTIGVNRNMTDFSTIKYDNSTTPTEIDSSFQTSYVLGYQFSMAQDLLFQIGYVGFVAEEEVARNGTQKISTEPYTGGGIAFGMRIGF